MPDSPKPTQPADASPNADRPIQPDGKLHGAILGIPHPHDFEHLAQGDYAHPELRWLVIRRSAHVASPLMIAFPGGARELGESWIDAAQREGREELGIDVEVGECVWQFDYPGKQLILQGYRSQIINPNDISNPTLQPDPNEVAATYWLTPQSICDHPDGLQHTDRFIHALTGR